MSNKFHCGQLAFWAPTAQQAMLSLNKIPSYSIPRRNRIIIKYAMDNYTEKKKVD
jgi:hypothetical protein